MLNHEPIRYILNGLVATFLHYGVLNFNIIALDIEPVGLANFLAAIFGISISFLGSRYFVYKKHVNAASSQVVRFLLLYGFIAIVSGFVLYVWSDLYGLSYHLGFIVATVIQMMFSYFGNKVFVFKKELQSSGIKMKVKKWLLISALFGIALFSIYVLHIKFFRVDVVFYSAILDGVLAAIITGVILYLTPYFNSFNGFEKSQMLFSFILIGYMFAISVPTVLDRSLSFYLLEKIEERGGGIKKSGFADVFTKEYMVEHRLVDVRLTEQLASGTIEIDSNECVKLTNKGRMLTLFSRYFRKNFLPKERLLMGEYSADLTDPFAHGAVDASQVFDYVCK